MSKELDSLRMLEQVCLVANVANMEEQINIIESTLERLERKKSLLGIDVFTFVDIMNPYRDIYVWDSHNREIVKLHCCGARRTYDGKEIHIENRSCSAWLELKEYGNTWSLYRSDLEKKWFNNKEALL